MQTNQFPAPGITLGREHLKLSAFLGAVVAVLVLTGLVPAARAVVPGEVAFSSFGSGNSYSTATVWGVSGASTSGGYRGQAEFFTPSVTGYLTGVTLATYHVSGSSLGNFFIAQDNGSGAPGAILETYDNIVNNSRGLLTINSVTDPLLLAGTQYWLCDEPAAANSYNGWYYNNQGYDNGFAFERGEWSWASIPGPAPASGVFSVNVTPIPEPTGMVLGLLGATVCLAARRAGFRPNPGL